MKVRIQGAKRPRGTAARILLAATAMAALSAGPARADLPMLTADGARLVDTGGKPVLLKGCNLGNWLILESWMFGGTLLVDGKPFHDQAALYERLGQRFGVEKAERLMDVFRAGYVTPRDFDSIKSFGFNTVRLPFDYRALSDDATPMKLRPNAFKWIDRALDMAEKAGVYVILDMHGVPGGQSKQDHTGQSDQNRLWTDPAAQDRTVWLWQQIAERYKNRGVVAAYDLINEPYSDFRQNVRPHLAKLMPRVAAAIREVGDQHVIYFPGTLGGGVEFYGDPNTHGMKNVGFTEHYYPGLFGSKSALETHARLLGAELPTKRAYLDGVRTPYLVGEFNVVLASEDPNRLMRMYYDRFADYGWAGTMWSYKLIKTAAGAGPSAWYMVTNADAIAPVDAATASYAEIEAMFRALATAPIAASGPLRQHLTSPTPANLPLAKYAPLPTAAPATPSADPAGFTSTDVAAVKPGHTAVDGDGVVLTAGGSDINAANDSFRFLAKPAHGATSFQATITHLADSNEWAKAGVMARWGDGPGAAMAMVNVFPGGSIALISRATDDGPTTETKIASGIEFPVQLKLDVRDGKAAASYRNVKGAWVAAGDVAVPAGAYRIGLAGCAHSDNVLTTVKAVFGPAGDAVLPAPAARLSRPAGPSLLTNGSFEQGGPADDQAAGWNRWGDWINREPAWTPTHDGKALVGYHHWQIDSNGSSGLWQDAAVKTGQRYTFTLFAQHDSAKSPAKDAESVELRLESVTPDGQITLNTESFKVEKLATGDGWTRLSVSGTAISDRLRVLAVVSASPDGPRGGAVKLDDATLTPATDGR